MREALHQWSTGAFRGPHGLTPRPEPETDDEDDSSTTAAQILRSPRSPLATVPSASGRRVGGGGESVRHQGQVVQRRPLL